jgi:hypothetical protein
VNIPVTNVRRFDTHRVLPAKYSPNYDSVLTRIADDDAHLQLIFELDNATNARLKAEESAGPGISARELVVNVPNYHVINAHSRMQTRSALDFQVRIAERGMQRSCWLPPRRKCCFIRALNSRK